MGENGRKKFAGASQMGEKWEKLNSNGREMGEVELKWERIF